MSDKSNKEVAKVSPDEVDLRKLFNAIWTGKWLIIVATMSTVLITAIAVFLMPNVYRAEALLAPAQNESSSGLAALASQYGGLASLAGLDLSGRANDKTAIGLEVLKSRQFISDFVERRELLVPLMAAKGWNWETGKLEIDRGDFDIVRGEWVRHVDPPRTTKPSLQEAYEEFREKLFVEQDNASGFIRIGFEHYSPTVAKQWIDWLVEDINHTIMNRDVTAAQQAIEFLNGQIDNTSLTDLREVLFRLAEEQMKTVMLASASEEYLFVTLDPAVVPEEEAGPRRFLIISVCGFMVLLLSTIIVIVREKIA